MSIRPIQFFGIGAQKSGTTWLYAYLKDHPQVFMPEIKELNYFWARSERREMHEAERQLAAMNRIMEDHPRKGAGMRRRIGDLGTLMAALSGRLEYRAIFGAAPEGTRAAGEISPSYAMLDARGFAEMADTAPEARFFFIMRDPIQRYWSSIRMLTAGRRETPDAEGIASVFRDHLTHKGSHLRRMTDYRATLAALEGAVAPERIHLMFYEDLFSPGGAEVLRGLTGFLGIDFVAPDLDRRVWSTSEAHVAADDLTDAMRRAALEVFAPVYDFAETRFGGRLPEAWRAGRARAEAAVTLAEAV